MMISVASDLLANRNIQDFLEYSSIRVKINLLPVMDLEMGPIISEWITSSISLALGVSLL